jgi:V/A-type H+-transporting ATPase subunit F|tara:strand:- start:550 stop:846 length:297 start_codon:yes stop_codon:yes gene_type:complete
MKVVTVGSRVFVTSFQLAGVQGKIVDSSDTAFEEIKKLYNEPEVGLVLVSDDLTEQINDKLTKLRAEKSTPLVFALPASGSEKSEVDYRVMLKKILGV